MIVMRSNVKSWPSARARSRAMAGSRATIGVVAAVGRHPKERPQTRRRELDPGPGLDVSGQKPDDGVVALTEPPDDRVDSGQHLHPRAVADLSGELTRVGLEALVEAGPDALELHPGRGHELVNDAQVGAAAEVEPLDRAGGAIGLREGSRERRAAGATHRYQRAVDVEEEEAHATGGPGGAGARPLRERPRAPCRCRPRSSSGPA